MTGLASILGAYIDKFESLLLAAIDNEKGQAVLKKVTKYSLQGTTQGNGLTGGVPPVRFSM